MARKSVPISVSHPEIAALLVDPKDGERYSHGSTKFVDWKCKKGHINSKRVSGLVTSSLCPYCSNKKLLPGFNDLATTHPHIAKRLADPSNATNFAFSCRTIVEVKCDEGHITKVRLDNFNNRMGCRICSGQSERFTRPLAETHPQLCMELVDQSIGNSITAGMNAKVEWVCQVCDHVWVSRVTSRTTKNAGCPRCAKGGYDPLLPGTFYAVSNGKSVKCGISNFPKKRLKKHANFNFLEVLWEISNRDGWVALSMESEWKKYVNENPQYRVDKKELPDGYTEAMKMHDGLLSLIESIATQNRQMLLSVA